MTTHNLQPAQPLIRRYLFVAAALLAAVYLACVNDRWYPTPDSALYAGLGRSLAEGRGYVFNGGVDNTATPGLPAVIAAARLLTGGDGWWVCNLFITASGLAALLFIRAVLRKLLPADAPPSTNSSPSPPTSRLRDTIASPAPAKLSADLATLMLAGSFLFFEHSHYILTDIPLVALAWAAFYAALRATHGHWAWLALAAGLCVAAMTIRAPMAPFLALLATGLVFGPLPCGTVREGKLSSPHAGETPAPRAARRRWFAAAVLLAATAVPFAFWYVLGRSIGPLPYVESATRLTAGFFARAGEAAWAQAGVMSTFLIGVPSMPWLGLILWPVALLGLAVLWRGFWLGLLVLVPYTLFIAVIRAADNPDRFMLPVAPLVYLGLTQGVWSLATAAGHLARARRNHATTALIVLTAAILLANVVPMAKLVHRMAWLAHTDRYDTEAKRGFVGEHKKVAELLANELPEEGRFLATRGPGRIVYYYSGRPFITPPPHNDGLLGPDDAQELWNLWQANPDIRIAVLPWHGRQKHHAYTARIAELFASERELHRGNTMIVFERR
ncbi:MAG: hypothetical protein FWE88_00690 [Phycisphaerae bacterium]|nr:hypothetical protein [Phycisphaerae bacterium]